MEKGSGSNIQYYLISLINNYPFEIENLKKESNKDSFSPIISALNMAHLPRNWVFAENGLEGSDCMQLINWFQLQHVYISDH